MNNAQLLEWAEKLAQNEANYSFGYGKRTHEARRLLERAATESIATKRERLVIDAHATLCRSSAPTPLSREVRDAIGLAMNRGQS